MPQSGIVILRPCQIYPFTRPSSDFIPIDPKLTVYAGIAVIQRRSQCAFVARLKRSWTKARTPSVRINAPVFHRNCIGWLMNELNSRMLASKENCALQQYCADLRSVKDHTTGVI